MSKFSNFSSKTKALFFKKHLISFSDPRYLNAFLLSALIAIVAINSSNAVCCYPSYVAYHKCFNLPGETKSDQELMTTHFYVKTLPNWKDNNLKKSICSTTFCDDGSEMTGFCGTGGKLCSLLGCFCDRCFTNDGTTYEDMEKAWVKKNGFTMMCDGYSGKCEHLDKLDKKF